MNKEMKILIVEDDEALLALTSYFVKKEGYSVDKAMNGFEADKLIKQNKYDGMILDIKMPIMDGQALVEKIHSESIYIPTVVCSGQWECDVIFSLVSSGVLNFISKPAKPKDVLAALSEVIERGKKVNSMLKSTSERAAELVDYSKK